MSAAKKIEQSDVLEKLKAVLDPDLGRDIVSLGFVKNIKICAPLVSFDIERSAPISLVKERFEADAVAAVKELPGIDEVNVHVHAAPRTSQAATGQTFSGIQTMIAVASGKGGVGKSTVAANLAVALQRTGAAVGLCDADVYGPSQSTMFGVDRRPEADEDRRLIPIEERGIKLMSMGFLTTKETPVIWRGPMATKLIQQFMAGVAWGELDYLIIDLPPGTGDVQLTLTQSVPLTGAIIVTTPQDVARHIAEKGLRMFQPVQVPVLGVIENMSYFVCSHCQERTYIFSQGGGEKTCAELGLPFLGSIPIDPDVVTAGDEGEPIVARNPDSAAAKAYLDIATRVAASVAVVSHESSSPLKPQEISEGEGELRIVWSDGHDSRYSFEFLRNHCPCAVCVDEWTGKRKSLVLLLPSNFRPVGVSPVGNYAIQISWSDGHNTGIYSFGLLRELCGCDICKAA
jgi:ATP-binding protein involved in chromosome partitioning